MRDQGKEDLCKRTQQDQDDGHDIDDIQVFITWVYRPVRREEA